MLCILKCYCRNWFYSCMLSKFCEVNLSLSAWCSNWLVKYACELCHIWKQMGIFFFKQIGTYTFTRFGKYWKLCFEILILFLHFSKSEVLNFYLLIGMLYICSIFSNVHFSANIFKVTIKYFFDERREICCTGYYDILMANTFHFIKETFLLENCK